MNKKKDGQYINRFYLKQPSIPTLRGQTEILPLGQWNEKRELTNTGIYYFNSHPYTLLLICMSHVQLHIILPMAFYMYSLTMILAIQQNQFSINKSICLFREFNNCFDRFVFNNEDNCIILEIKQCFNYNIFNDQQLNMNKQGEITP